jgi:hypothetical protein
LIKWNTFAHRVGYVTEIQHFDKDHNNRIILARNKCHGIARIVFADSGKTKYNQVEDNNEILGYKDE